MDFIVAIPSYLRATELNEKTLITLKNGGIPPEQIFIFVADDTQELTYKYILNKNNYNKIIVGELGIRNQRIFISKYFPENTNIVSCDDDTTTSTKITCSLIFSALIFVLKINVSTLTRSISGEFKSAILSMGPVT